MKTIQFEVSDEVYSRLIKHPRYPRREWGAHKVPDFYRECLLNGSINSYQFQVEELQAQLRNKDWQIKYYKDTENERLRREVAALKAKAEGIGKVA